MKKNILLLLFSFCLYGLHAQNVTLDPQEVDVEEELNANNDHEAHSTVTNNADSLIRFVWERNVVTIPSEWNSAICDKIRCYLPNVNTAEFDLDAMAGGDMIAHVYPNGVEGTARIEVTIYNKEDASNTVTGFYNFTLGTTGTLELNRQLLKLFPNPTRGEINLQFSLERPTEVKVEIQNIIGQRLSVVDYGNMSGEQTLRLNDIDLNNGLYFVVIHLDEYVMTRKLKVSK